MTTRRLTARHLIWFIGKRLMGQNAIWQADHTPLDILLVRPEGDPAKPWLTAIVDDFSRAALLVIDEADRLKMSGPEQVRNIFDHGGFGLVLIGMPGIEKCLARYPQFYSRIGFVHDFRSLAAKEIRQLLDQHWTPLGVHLPLHPLGPETLAAIIRITGSNFRLLNRLLYNRAYRPPQKSPLDTVQYECNTECALRL